MMDCNRCWKVEAPPLGVPLAVVAHRRQSGCVAGRHDSRLLPPPPCMPVLAGREDLKPLPLPPAGRSSRRC